MMGLFRPNGDFLQVGFGKKEIASRWITYHPKSYTLIEGDLFVLEKVDSWVKKHPQVVLFKDIWQKALPTLSVFDTIYCELNDASGLWPELTHIRYSDRDLEIFCKAVSKTNPEQLFRFLHELTHNGQITKEQLNSMIHHYKLEGSVPRIKKSYAQMIACLKMCLESHMRVGSLFAAPLDDLSAAYENPLFAQIALDPFVEIRDVGEGVVVEKFGP